MQLAHFKTLWGHEGSLEEAVSLALDAGFEGLEALAQRTQRVAISWANSWRTATCNGFRKSALQAVTCRDGTPR